MTHRERAIIAIRGGQPDYVPHFELVFHQTERDFQGRTFFGTPFAPPLTDLTRRDMLLHNAQLHVDVARRFDHSIIMVAPLTWPVVDNHADLVELLQMVRDTSGHEFCLMATADPTFKIPSNPVAMAELAHDDPAALKRQAQEQVDAMLPVYDDIMAAGADGVIMCSDYAFNSGTFFSPAQFADFVTPYLAQAVRAVKDRGGLVIKHSDGNLMAVMDQLVQAAPHALHSIDPMADMDIRRIKQDYGDKLALCGNVHCAHLQTGTPQQIRQSAEYCLTHAKPNGGYIFSTSNCVFRGMPLASYDLIHQIWKDNRLYT